MVSVSYQGSRKPQCQCCTAFRHGLLAAFVALGCVVASACSDREAAPAAASAGTVQDARLSPTQAELAARASADAPSAGQTLPSAMNPPLATPVAPASGDLVPPVMHGDD